MKWAKRIIIIFLSAVLLLGLLAGLFYVPSVQTYVLRRATEYATHATGMNVHFERVRLGFPLRLSLEEAVVTTSESDTVASIERLTAYVRTRPLIDGIISVKSFIVKDLQINTGKVTTGSFAVIGRIDEVEVHADYISPFEARATVDIVRIERAVLDIDVCDTMVSASSPSSPSKWVIGLKDIDMLDSRVNVSSLCDSVALAVGNCSISLIDGLLDLDVGKYGASEASGAIDSIVIHKSNAEEYVLSNITWEVDSAIYSDEYGLSAEIAAFRANEAITGFQIMDVCGKVVLDSVMLTLPSLTIRTDCSSIELSAVTPLSVTGSDATSGFADARLKAVIGSADAERIANKVSASKYTERVLKAPASSATDSMQKLNRNDFLSRVTRVEAVINGDLHNLNIKNIGIVMDEAFSLSASGNIRSVGDERLRSGHITLNLETQDAEFANHLLPLSIRERFCIPDSLKLSGDVKLSNGKYSVEAALSEAHGMVSITSDYDVNSELYNCELRATHTQCRSIMPDDSLILVSMSASLHGRGTDVCNKSTRLEADVKFDTVVYGPMSLGELTLTASLSEERFKALLHSGAGVATGEIVAEGELSDGKMHGHLRISGAVDTSSDEGTSAELTSGYRFNLESAFGTDFANEYSLEAILNDASVRVKGSEFQSEAVYINMRSSVDSALLNCHVGDLQLELRSVGSMPTLVGKLSALGAEAVRRFRSDTVIPFQELRSSYPELTAGFRAGNNNPLYKFLQEKNIYYGAIQFDVAMSSDSGLSMNGEMSGFIKDTLKIDAITLRIEQDTLGLAYNMMATKNRFRNQEPFRAGVSGYIHECEADAYLQYYNGQGAVGASLGVNVRKSSGGYDFCLYPENPVIAFMPFKLKSGSYIHYANKRDCRADIRFDGSDNTSLWFRSDTSSAEMELMAEINHIDLSTITSGIGGLPSMRGKLSASLRYVPSEESFMITGDCYTEGLYYSDDYIGELLLNVTYMPMTGNTHQIDIHAFHDLKEMCALSAIYTADEARSEINGTVTLTDMPLSLVNGFINGGGGVTLDGTLNGDLEVRGSADKPVADGYLRFSGARLAVPQTGSMYRLDDKQLNITGSRLLFDSFRIYDSRESSITIDGYIDNLTKRPETNINISATNIQPLSPSRIAGSIAWGRLYVDFNATLVGSFDALKLRGNAHILGNTNLTYLAPQSVDEAADNHAGLITFTYFADTLPRRQRRQLQGLATSLGADVFLNIKIDPVVKLRIDMSEQSANRADLRGGGDLTVQYNRQQGLLLNGRYTMSEGTIRYSIPVIPLTDFTVRDGSYIDWNGEALNPTLNISAYTRVRSSVNYGGQSRMVDFNAGIALRNSLDDISIEFLLEAPSDAAVQTQLSAMGSEERSKQAVSLLVAGLYLAGEGSGSDNVNVGQALNTLLQRELKHVLGSVMDEMPFTFDVNTYDGTSGMARRIDYLARFYATLFNERLKSGLGMRYSTKDPVYGNRFFIDDVSLEYRIDRDGARSVSLFHNKQYESLFEGEITKTGVGFTLRRKVKRIGELFLPYR
jgi:hypothetical protein